MLASVQNLDSLVKDAKDETKQLSKFQGSFKWKTSEVAMLLDSIRKGCHIGSLSFVKIFQI